LTPFYRGGSRRRKVRQAGSPTGQSFPEASCCSSRSSSAWDRLWCPTLNERLDGKAGRAPLTRAGLQLGRCLRASPPGATEPQPSDVRPAGGARARSAGRGAPDSRKSRPLALGKCRRGACALRLRPLPGERPDLGARGRWRRGSAAVSARAAPNCGRVAEVRAGPAERAAARLSDSGSGPRGPELRWDLSPSPACGGGGAAAEFPFFLQLRAWGSDCSKVGAGRTQVSASATPLAWWGGAGRDTPSAPARCVGSAATRPCKPQGRRCAPGPSRAGLRAPSSLQNAAGVPPAV
jgi:hypothetical protein